MKRPFLYLMAGLLCGAITATGVLYGAGQQQLGAAPVRQISIAPCVAETDGEFTVRTGQSFWGMHLQGVIPCSTMLVKGGGNLVILATQDRPLEHASFHVKSKKTIELNGRRFEVSVKGDDMIEVRPPTSGDLAARS